MKTKRKRCKNERSQLRAQKRRKSSSYKKGQMKKFTAELEAFTPGNRNNRMLPAAGFGVRAGLSDEEIETMILEHLGRDKRGNEIQREINKARQQEGQPWDGKTKPKKEVPPPDQMRMVQLASKGYRRSLIDESPIPPTGEWAYDAAMLIRTLHAQSTPVWCSGYYDKGDEYLKAAGEWSKCLEEDGDTFIQTHWIANPLSVEGAVSEGHISYRCDNAVTRGAYALLEIDPQEGGPISWCRRRFQEWILLGLIDEGCPIVSAVWSGGKSIHALIKVNVEPADWKTRTNWSREDLCRLGGDPAASNLARLTRLPHPAHYEQKDGKKKWYTESQLLYLNPDHAIP